MVFLLDRLSEGSSVEADVDSLPWRDDLVIAKLPIADGYLIVSGAPNCRTTGNLAMAAVERHQWKGNITTC